MRWRQPFDDQCYGKRTIRPWRRHTSAAPFRLFTLHWWGAYSPWRPTRHILTQVAPGAVRGARTLVMAGSGAPLAVPSRLGKMEAVRDPSRASAATSKRRRRLSLGLRAHVTVAFAVAGLVVSLGLALITYSLARSFLLQQRDSAARTQ